MKIHNLMEDIVIEKVHEIFDEEEKEMKNKGYCTCHQCRLDVACYVLNRANARYVSSSRGLTHLRTEYQEDIQKSADLVSMVNDGIIKVSSTKRPHYDHSFDEESPPPEGPMYNLPTIMGRLLNGTTFEPMQSIDIYLKSNGEIVEMFEPSWQNPYKLIEKTAGTFVFWPRPVHSDSPETKRTFEFEIVVDAEGYEELHHFFEMSVEAESAFDDSFHLQHTYKLEDLYLFSI